MKSRRSLGLVVEGNATSSLVLRLPSLKEDLGPVKAGALRVARRVSNFLRAGYAVRDYEELQPAGLIFLRVPDAIAPRIVEELCASDLALREVSFVLCETWLSASTLQPLQARGAWTATLAPVQSPRKRWFVIEGELTAVRQVRRFLERNDARAFELRPGTKSLYLAAHLLATGVPLQILAQAQQALRTAGISGNHVYELLEEMSFEMFRSFSNGARLTLPGTRAVYSPELSHPYFEHLHRDDPHIAALLDQHIRMARHGGKKKSSRDILDLPGD